MWWISFVWIISIIAGAFIGGITNVVAISMLFRPYKAKFFFSWKLPFTPGLIPRRHKDIAYQLGQIIEQHLVTKESLEEYLQTPEVQHQLRQWLDDTFQDYLQRIRLVKVGEITSKLGLETEQMAEHAANEILKRGNRLVTSIEGERLIYQFMQNALQKQSGFRKVIDALLPKERIVHKIQEVISEGLASYTTKHWVREYIYTEMRKLELMELGELLTIQTENKIQEQIPKLLEQIVNTLNQQIVQLVGRLKLAKIVENQVLSFPLPRLEELIKSVAHRELKMITWFGALLGGILGGIQALIFTILQFVS
ncbi:DUF445 domain-containing protein [Bacillus horti]|uniref:Uncharacterized membrane protein YheB (UPF0754 family) n=1 Tax=Caldalkalibacillus horti TaxID=77523 RepID=A0ABT9VW07_9BACI|nr:DUF445 family protein [Bacillus horti]MDQ0165187.1 uncharacterized membrane protein YheB (UPF0754 family) [Bacillus horti]